MPNWCKGDLKVRGTRENVEKFLLEGLLPVDIFGVSEEKPVVESDDYELAIKLEKGCFYLKGTRRNFIDAKHISYYFPEDGEASVLVLEDCKGAWAIDVDGLRSLSEEFGVDFKILGFEKGMQFNQDIEIIAGEIVKNEDFEFDDYEWECIRPHIGG